MGPDGLTPTETLAGAANSPFTSDPTAVDVLAATTSLQNLTITFSATPVVNVESTGTIVGATDGSSITVLTQTGQTLTVAADRTFKWTPAASGNRTLTPTETLGTAVNSPFTSSSTTVAVAAAQAAAAFRETFSGATGSALASRPSESGHNWSLMPGITTGTVRNFQVGSGYALASDTTSPGAWMITDFAPISPNYRVDATVKCNTAAAVTSSATIYIRAGASSDTGYTIVYNSFSGAWTFQKREASGNTSLGTVTSKLANGASGVMSLVCNGTTLSFYVNGTLVITVTDTVYQAAGSLGMKYTGGSVSASSGAAVDELTVTYL